ncbi:hypothetical protein PTSG_00123 [Salpingoeca rosetta]|uniref:Uncharacterized protein n=1 Tax=Salpingoeca rosetta (strain ATCC 50818 / BSB-021) TaxID=946362 RepID=F2TVL1_SALR5|nr:uncharacterized protein PTSG_00123 [Salpingoeca rosetta]EGD72107.1 hypothetical protein PTSG_00123 [Salpingoeca rosetta]|eukprot:XP_004998679.1 hypothetical protein PTSG_00123 [Salpingoeca rosetta]
MSKVASNQSSSASLMNHCTNDLATSGTDTENTSESHDSSRSSDQDNDGVAASSVTDDTRNNDARATGTRAVGPRNSGTATTVAAACNEEEQPLEDHAVTWQSFGKLRVKIKYEEPKERAEGAGVLAICVRELRDLLVGSSAARGLKLAVQVALMEQDMEVEGTRVCTVTKPHHKAAISFEEHFAVFLPTPCSIAPHDYAVRVMVTSQKHARDFTLPASIPKSPGMRRRRTLKGPRRHTQHSQHSHRQRSLSSSSTAPASPGRRSRKGSWFSPKRRRHAQGTSLGDGDVCIGGFSIPLREAMQNVHACAGGAWYDVLPTHVASITYTRVRPETRDSSAPLHNPKSRISTPRRLMQRLRAANLSHEQLVLKAIQQADASPCRGARPKHKGICHLSNLRNNAPLRAANLSHEQLVLKAIQQADASPCRGARPQHKGFVNSPIPRRRNRLISKLRRQQQRQPEEGGEAEASVPSQLFEQQQQQKRQHDGLVRSQHPVLNFDADDDETDVDVFGDSTTTSGRSSKSDIDSENMAPGVTSYTSIQATRSARHYSAPTIGCDEDHHRQQQQRQRRHNWGRASLQVQSQQQRQSVRADGASSPFALERADVMHPTSVEEKLRSKISHLQRRLRHTDLENHLLRKQVKAQLLVAETTSVLRSDMMKLKRRLVKAEGELEAKEQRERECRDRLQDMHEENMTLRGQVERLTEKLIKHNPSAYIQAMQCPLSPHVTTANLLPSTHMPTSSGSSSSGSPSHPGATTTRSPSQSSITIAL